MTSVFCHPPER